MGLEPITRLRPTVKPFTVTNHFVGIVGFEPTTFRVSGERSHQAELYSNLVVQVGLEPTMSAM